MNTIENTKIPASIQVTLKSRLPQEAYAKNANIYKVFANPKRLEILNLLKGGEMGVEYILKITGLSKANLSQHLALMRHNGIVQTRRQGQNIFYRIIDPRIVEPCKILHDLRTKRLVV
jgi:ArsR family transcriptional regulator